MKPILSRDEIDMCVHGTYFQFWDSIQQSVSILSLKINLDIGYYIVSIDFLYAVIYLLFSLHIILYNKKFNNSNVLTQCNVGPAMQCWTSNAMLTDDITAK